MRRALIGLFALSVAACEGEEQDDKHCAVEEFPGFPPPFGGSALRVPFETEGCRADYCDQTRDAFEADLTCVSAEEAALRDEDAGAIYPDQEWIRSEGCGSVQFHSYSGYPTFRNFDARSGALIGWAFMDDLGSLECNAPGWVAGEVRHECEDEVVSVCTRPGEE